jgi:hypothetical protein
MKYRYGEETGGVADAHLPHLSPRTLWQAPLYAVKSALYLYRSGFAQHCLAAALHSLLFNNGVSLHFCGACAALPQEA